VVYTVSGRPVSTPIKALGFGEKPVGSENTSEDNKQHPLPEDALVVKQIPWAWVYSSMPWILVLFVLLLIPLLDEFTALFVALVILVPRYLGWRRTMYALTDDTLVYQRGGFTGAQTFEIPVSSLKSVRTRYGFFGRSLGYKAVDILLDDNAIASMTYVPITSELGDRLREMVGEPEAAPEEVNEEEEPADESGDAEPDRPA